MSAFVVWRSADRIRIEAGGSAIELSSEDACLLASVIAPELPYYRRANKRWTEEEIAEVKRLYAQGERLREIGLRLGRPLTAVAEVVRKLGIASRNQGVSIANRERRAAS